MAKHTDNSASEQTLAIVSRHHQYWLQGDIAGIMSLYHPDIRYFDYLNNIEITRDELADYLSFTLLTPSQVTLQHTDRIRVDGDTAFIQYQYSIKRANNKAYHYRSSEALTVQDGKIIRINEYSSLMRSQEELSSTQKGKIGLDDSRLQILLQDLSDYFEKHQPYLDSRLNLAQVAQATGYTRNQISYALNNGLQKSFYEYVNLSRIEHLLLLLQQDSNRNISDVALQVGFNSSSTFYKFFKQFTGLTPKAYLKNIQA
ncbi:nuclear transport factor 2 family protein [Dasania sp. GY-MA-18]|uniref:Nuclear transport factor 2 family protein n=1 Tax=Dasania phycosphaerae TaxID=2950436 RepID=A0A9J6RLL0_9GAMM|nr:MULTISPECIES: nuclear transport factor 2 family protein [Dasania]MCR8922835.1 nuclear transport factor 2 family protein [Dasania sp. GY-MA-18]MCZ0865266.1 nuclear transport factor 2 family protein [Dasania phycosphaerae]MCZ0868991.1 nuclear transport factor 2 family protein [Dasania phycosphaerae]